MKTNVFWFLSQIFLVYALQCPHNWYWNTWFSHILQRQISWYFTTMKNSYSKILAMLICLQIIFITFFPLGAGKLILINYTIEILYNGYKKYLHHYPHFLTKRVFLPSFIFHLIVSNLCGYTKVLNDRKLDIHEFN